MNAGEKQTLLAKWQALWRELGAEPDATLFQRLIDAWSEPQRKYHTLQHLCECLANFESLRHLPEHPAEVGLAIWFHDAVYDVTRHDNERRSADWAKAEMLKAGLPAAMAARVDDLIMATCHNAEPAGIDAQVLVDIDLWILGAPRARFEEYERQVREEYGHVPEALFRQGRRAILEQFLARPRLFSTPDFLKQLDMQARSNLQLSLKKLTAAFAG